MLEIENNVLIRCIPEENETTIYIPEGVRLVEKYAFANCENITEVVFSSSIQSVNQDAFVNCPNLETLILNEGLSWFSSDGAPSPISNCPKLVSLELPTTIHSCSLRDTSVKDLSFREGTTAINVNEFGVNKDCFNNVEQIFLPKSIKSIRFRAFAELKSLRTVRLDADLTELPSSLFAGCSNLQNFSMPQSVKKIGTMCFSDTAISSITIPEGVTIIEEDTFSGCKNLHSIVLPESITEIHYGAFYDSGLESIRIPHNVRVVGAFAFYCDNLKDVTICSRETRFVKDICTFNGEYVNMHGEGFEIPSEWKVGKMILILGAILVGLFSFWGLPLLIAFYFNYKKKYGLILGKPEHTKHIWNLAFRRKWYERVPVIEENDPNLPSYLKH